MELIQLPKPMRDCGFTGWPEVYRIGAGDPPPPLGISYVRAEKTDFALLFRLMVPILMKQHAYFDWAAIYQELVGEVYYPQRVYVQREIEGTGAQYDDGGTAEELVTIEQLASDKATYVDLDVLTQLGMVPAFMEDIREAISVNVTNNFAWEDGYNKKHGICSGSMTEQPRNRNLVILDISSSIPDGVSAGMLTLISTITDITNADLIVTGSKSFFYTNEEAKVLDIHMVRRIVGRNNESKMFRQILKDRDMDYKNIICFGDSDNPGPIELVQPLHVKNVYSYYTMVRDTYGVSYEAAAGYCRWAIENCPSAVVHHDTNWAKFFKRSR